jgi:hypothetical protein
MNDGREKMRSALGMTLETSTEDAIKRFWTLAEFLNLGTAKKIGKLDKDMNERNKSRQSIISNILSEIRVKQEKIEVEGKSFKERFLLLIHYGDWLSYWCAILHNTDPSPVENIQVLKNKLSKI